MVRDAVTNEKSKLDCWELSNIREGEQKQSKNQDLLGC